MKAGFELAGRWKIIDGKDLLTIWLSADGFNCQRIVDFNNPAAARGHAPTIVKYEDLILAAEGQKKLL